MSFDLATFIRESNLIESITRAPTREECYAHLCLLDLLKVEVQDLECFVRAINGAPLRREPGMDVRVGSHVAPRGGPEIEERLSNFLEGVCAPTNWDPHSAHIWYETLHPFLDGNGRSGRALWLWQMQHYSLPIYGSSFLRTFYYQTLAQSRVQERRT